MLSVSASCRQLALRIRILIRHETGLSDETVTIEETFEFDE